MTSGITTTEGASSHSNRYSGRGKALLLAALVLLALGLIVMDLRRTSWYQDWRYARMSVAELQRERAGRQDNPRLLYYLGLRLNAQGRFAEADPYLRIAVGLDPNEARLRDAWAQALLRSGQITAAYGELRQFVGTHPRSSKAHLLLGKFYLTQSAMGRAVEELSEAVRQDPSLAEGWSYLAAAQSGLGHSSQAEQAIERAVVLRPKSVTDRLGLALLLLEIGQTQRARETFKAAEALSPGSAAVHREYARCLLKAGGGPADLSHAESEARKALQLNANDPGAALVLGQVLAADGRASEALPYLQRAADAGPYDPASAYALTQAYRRLHQERPAAAWEQVYLARSRHAARKADLVTAIQKSSRDAEAQRQMAALLAEEGDVTGCVRHEAEALHCAVDAPPAFVAAANALEEAGHAQEALPLAEHAVNAARNNPMAREALGNVQLALGRPQEAIRSYGQAARGLPDRLHLYQRRLEAYLLRHRRQLGR